MSADLQAIWSSDECPVIDGVFFADGRVVVLDIRGPRTRGGRYTVSPKTVTTLKVVLKGGLGSRFLSARLSEHRDPADGSLAIVGDTSWESEGFVALFDAAGSLSWLFVADRTDPFVEVKNGGGVVIARSSLGYAWRFPKVDPSAVIATWEGQ